jgi:hypothetical protein
MFGLVTSAVYGPQALAGEPWIVLTLFGLLVGPFLMCLASRAASCREKAMRIASAVRRER